MPERLGELIRLFLKLGTISFGGPAAHIALMEEEVVRRRNWLSREQFLDLLGATYLIPGPNAIEMAAYIGHRRAGLLGLVVAGASFTLPAAAITAVLAWAYVSYQALPQIKPWVDPLLAGIKPAVLAIVVAAICRLGKTALGTWELAAIGLGVAAASWAGAGEVASLVAGGILGAVVLRWLRPGSGEPPKSPPDVAVGAVAVGAGGSATAAAAAAAGAGTAGVATVSLGKLALFFLKVGAVLYGSGYVLIAYIEGGLVDDYGWLKQEELLDAVAVGQITPGPLISTVTFVGYVVAGLPGAAVATVAVVLPGLCLVALVNPWIARLRSWAWAGRFLDAASAASIGLTAVVAIRLAQGTLLVDTGEGLLPDWRGCVVALAAGAVLWRWKVAPAWLVLAGAVAGRVLWR